MAIDWGLAARLGGMGFGLVFAVLLILALTIWLMGFSVRIFGMKEPKEDKTKKEIEKKIKDSKKGD